MNIEKATDIYYTLQNIRDLHNLLLSSDTELVKITIEKLAEYNDIINKDMEVIKDFINPLSKTYRKSL